MDFARIKPISPRIQSPFYIGGKRYPDQILRGTRHARYRRSLSGGDQQSPSRKNGQKAREKARKPHEWSLSSEDPETEAGDDPAFPGPPGPSHGPASSSRPQMRHQWPLCHCDRTNAPLASVTTPRRAAYIGAVHPRETSLSAGISYLRHGRAQAEQTRKVRVNAPTRAPKCTSTRCAINHAKPHEPVAKETRHQSPSALRGNRATADSHLFRHPFFARAPRFISPVAAPPVTAKFRQPLVVLNRGVAHVPLVSTSAPTAVKCPRAE